MTSDSPTPKRIKIWNATKREYMIIKRYGGDLLLQIWRKAEIGDYYIAFEFLAEMRKPYKKNFEKIAELFSQIKQLLVQRE